MNNEPPTTVSKTDSRESELKEQDKVTKITAYHVFIIFSIKIITSLFSRSMSFFSELSDSILDFAALFITYVGLKESRKNPDYTHMFGHYKINSAAGLIQSLLIIGMYVYIFWTSLQTLYQTLFLGIPYETENSLIQVIILVVSLGFVFVDSNIIIRIGKKQNNTLIMAQGQNFRGDLYRNVSFIIGLTIASFGFGIVDLFLALLFSIRSIVNGFGILKRSFAELIDTNFVSQEDVEELENKIKKLPDVRVLELFAVKSNGNRLDCHVNARIDQQLSVFGGNLIADQIRDMIYAKFNEHFLCNVFIQFNVENNTKQKELDVIFDYIRDIGMKAHEIRNIHNIAIDEFQDEIVVKYHIDLMPDMQLKLGHKIATELEHSMADLVRAKLGRSKPIQVISHIEPITEEKKTHSHSTTRPVPETKRDEVRQIIMATPNVKGIKDLQMQIESEGFFVVVKVYLDPDISIANAHDITNQIELNVGRAVPRVRYCLVHAEPFKTD